MPIIKPYNKYARLKAVRGGNDPGLMDDCAAARVCAIHLQRYHPRPRVGHGLPPAHDPVRHEGRLNRLLTARGIC